MSLYQFFPMKKRKVCKTPNGRTRRLASTLGKFKRSSDGTAPGAGGNGIEILWDNNSPSPTTTIALAGKRRRQNPIRHEEAVMTDVSFVVQKLSENTSPVSNHAGHSGLLEMWTDKAEHKIVGHICEDDFSSPPFRQTKYEDNTASPQSTPLIQRRTTRRQSRKATRQFMLEIRKLVEEIQKSDLSCSSQSQKEIQGKISEDRSRMKRMKRNEESSSSVTQVKQHASTNGGEQDCKTNVTCAAEASAAISDCLLEDSFEWTEDDMDELILTCQLSSSGKGSLTIPEASKPRFGASPSQVSFVPETQFTQIRSRTAHTETQKRTDASSHEPQCTQILFPEGEDGNIDEGGDGALNTSEVRQFEHAQQIPEQEDTDQWDFDDDDSLLATAMHEFELSQKAVSKQKYDQNDTNNKHGGSRIGGSAQKSDDDFVTSNLTNHFNLTERRLDKSLEERTNSSTSKEPVKNSLSTTRTSSRSTINSKVDTKQQKISTPTTSHSITGRTNDFNVKQLNKIAVKRSGSNNLLGKRNCAQIAKDASNSGTSVLEKPFNKMMPQTNSTNMLGKGFCAKQINERNKTKDVSSGSMTTPRGRGGSLPNLTQRNGNRHPRDNLTGDLECPKGKLTRQTTTNNNSTRGFVTKPESKSSLVPQSKLQNSSETQPNENQENEFDFLMSEDDFTALLDDFNFDDVLAKTAANQGSAKATNNSIRSFTNSSARAPSLPATSEGKVKYSQAEIERKRKEAQRRRMAKAKQKSSTHTIK
ncbi:uncharacterized protein LOC114532497 [Dendronephthya gigantea]|uniref:uncharacterized protein LOC114532497 n=1 Tax=Dendronephthya gigantea TaxID=151771 RepID=UPI00106D93C0|nr:uncharacterized protein LOC114532497 [Dendronephthya gigantea]